MSLHPFRLVVAASLGFALLIYSPAVSHADAGDEKVDPAQIAEWIVQLDDDLYALRKKAQQELEHAGPAALEAIAQEARTGSLESSTRALNVMLSWTESTDHDLQIATLEKLITLPNRPIEAGMAAELLAEARELEALEAFAKLGGKYANLPFLIKGRLPALHLIIDLDWEGELEGLKHLSAMPRTAKVSFRSVPLGDGMFEYLVNLPNVKRIEFIGTKVSEEMVEKIKTRVPGVFVEMRKSAARLGISTRNGLRQGPVFVDKVFPGTAAAKAGLRHRDEIAEFNSEKIRDFTDLTKRIGEFQPGESVELTIMRNGKAIKKTVSFDHWGDGLMETINKTPGKFPANQIVPSQRRILERR